MPSSTTAAAMTSLTPSVLEVNIRRLMAKCEAKAHGVDGILQGADRTKYLANIKALKEMMVVLDEDLTKRSGTTVERNHEGKVHNSQTLANNSLRISNTQNSTRDQAQIEAALQNDRAQREEMEAGLSMLMQQLRHNAMAIHQTLADEKSSGLLDDADQALDSNITRLGKERTRLELYSKQSRKTKWIIWGIVLVVSLVFVFMFFIIRIF
ncbi:hypothetical protein EC968_002090 [Mortierella alpina]|nr:hypothetical protein EC968_002090 [Mortierella alpina]